MPPQLRQLDVGQALQAFTTGQDRAAVRQRRNVFRQAGSALAAGDEAGAAASLLEAGELETGIQLQNLSTQRKKALIDNIAAGAVAADTPEKWQKFIQRSGQVFGENTVAQFRDFSAREGVIAQSLGAKGQLDLQFKRESAARDRERLGLERERVDIQRAVAQEKITASQAKRATRGSPIANTRSDGKAATGKFVTFVDPKTKKRTTVRQDSAAADALVEDGAVPSKNISAETAGRFGLIKTGLDNLKKARQVFLQIDPKTGKRREGAGGVTTFIGETIQTQLSAGEIGRAQRAVRVAVEGALRAATGAAAPETEVQRALDQFMPNPTDGIETRTQKLDLLEQFLRNTQTALIEGAPPLAPGEGGQTVASGKGDQLTTPGGNTFRVVQ
jgi:hypothetical protein